MRRPAKNILVLRWGLVFVQLLGGGGWWQIFYVRATAYVYFDGSIDGGVVVKIFVKFKAKNVYLKTGCQQNLFP